MRNKVALHYGGHPFEEKYTCLTDLQLVVLYRQVFLDERDRVEHVVESYIKPLSKAWSDKFNDLTKNLSDKISMFTNPKLFGRYEELVKQREFEAEAKESNLEELLFETLATVPTYYEIETEEDSIANVDIDSETESMITGWVDNKEDILDFLRK